MEQKKLEKLNLRISDSERDSFERARIKAGFGSVSAWARKALLSAAETELETSDKPIRDLAIQFSAGRILFGTNDLQDELLEIAIPNESIVEGHVFDVDTCATALRQGIRKLSEKFNLSRAYVLVTGRIVPSTMPFLKNLVREATGLERIFTIEFGMANAMGIGLEVMSPDSQPILSIEDDWMDFAKIRCAGLKSQSSRACIKSDPLNDENVTNLLNAVGCAENQIHVSINGDNLGIAKTLEGNPRFHVHREKFPALVGARKAIPTVRQLFPAS